MVMALLGSAVAEAGVPSLATPGSVSASAVSTSQIAVSWDDANPAGSGFQEAGYIIQQQAQGQTGWTKVFMSDPDATGWTASGLDADTTYSFRIKAYMFVSGEVVYSPYSATATATTLSIDFPDAPTNLTTTPMSTSQIKLNWHDTSKNEDGFIVSRAPAYTGLWVAVATLGKGQTTYTDSGLGPATAYAYKVRAYNAAGKSAPSNVVIESTLGNPPNQLPVADAGPDQVTQTLTTLSFNGSGSRDPDGTIVSYQWNFGDGSTASGITANHAYAAPGSYTVTLTVTDNAGGQGSATASVNATNRPPVASAGPNQTVTVNSPVSFNGSGSSDPDGTITSYAWSFGDGGSSSGSNVSHTYSNTGSFTATLTVTDNSGARSTATASVTVNPQTGGGPAITQWSKKAGGTGSDAGTAITLDRSGNMIVAGVAKGGVDFGGGVVPGTGTSAFIAKYSSARNYLWAKRFDGSNGSSTAYAVATDPNNGTIFLTGAFIGTVNFGGADLTSAGWPTVPNQDVFLAAFSSSGAHLWSVSFGGGLDDFGYGLAATSNGDVIVTGQIGGRVNIGCGIMSTTSSSHDMFLARFGGSSGACQWAKFVGGSAEDSGTGVTVASNGDIVVSGYFQGTANFGGGSVTSAGLSDIFVARYTSQGTYLWARTFGSTGDDRANAVALDSSGNVAVAGYFSGTVNFGGTTLTSGGSWDAFVAKYSSSGGLIWARDLGGTATDEAFGVDTDSSGNVVVVGGFQGTMNLGGSSLTSNGFWDAFLGKFAAANGDHMWSKSFGSAQDDLAYGVTVDGSDTAIVTGYFQNSVNFAGPEGTLVSAGLTDMFIIGMAP